MTTAGAIVSIQRCPGMRKPMESLAEGRLIADLGLEGDRHAQMNKSRQILLIEAETLERLTLSIGDVKENITTRGIALMPLAAGQRVRLGVEAVLELTGECEPCPRMEEVRAGLQWTLQGQRGMLARVVTGGVIRAGDAITILDEETTTP
jgi:MOSC domain-containing protein YiiM